MMNSKAEIDANNPVEDNMNEGPQSRSSTQRKNDRCVGVYEVKVKRENKKKELDTVSMYLSDFSEDCTYQYKYQKMLDFEISDLKFIVVAVKQSKSLQFEDTKLNDLFSEILKEVKNFDQFGRIESSPKRVNDTDVRGSRNSALLKTQLQKIGLEARMVPNIFQPDFYPNLEVLDTYDREILKSWLEDKEESFVYYNFTQAMLKLDEKENPKVRSMNPFIQAGVKKWQIDCVCLYLSLRFSAIRKSELFRIKNERKYKEAYDLISDTLMNSGIIYSLQSKEANFVFLKFFYILLDCFPEFNAYCLNRIQPALEFMSEKGPGRDPFKAEISLLKNNQIIRDLAMVLLLEYDITSDTFIYTMNLLEYLCNSSEKFYYLGLFLGDFYDPRLLGTVQQADEEKRTGLYELAERSKFNPEILAFNSRARLSIMYQNKFEQLVSAHDRRQNDIQESELVGFYHRILEINEELIKWNHPTALTFYAMHYIKCNDQKIGRHELMRTKDIFEVSTVILNRGESLSKAAGYLRSLFILGETSTLETFYRLLKLMKYEEAFFAAARIVGDGTDDNTYIPLAFCMEKGIGGSIDNEFALRVYLKTISGYLENRDLYKISLVLHRISLILRRGGSVDRAQELLKQALVFLLSTNFKQSVDKRFIFYMSSVIQKLNIPDKDNLVRLLLMKAYQMYPKNLSEYLIHYEIEKKIDKKVNSLKSKIKPDLNHIGNAIRICQSFKEEAILRAANGNVINETIKILSDLKLELQIGTGMDSEEAIIESIEMAEKKGIFLSDIHVRNLATPPHLYGVERNPDAAQKFKKIAERMEIIDKERIFEKSSERQLEYMIYRITATNKHVRMISDSSLVEVIKDKGASSDMKPDLRLFELPLVKMKWLSNNQFCRRMSFEFESIKNAKSLIENFEYFFTYNPHFLNYYGINYIKQPNRQIIQLYSEYFETTAAHFPKGFLRGNDLPLDKMQKVAYQLIHAVRSLHTIGRVCFYLDSPFIALTRSLNVHLILPFFMDYWIDPDLFINRATTWEQIAYFSPEVFQNRGNLKYFCRNFELLDPKFDTRLWQYSSASDIWSLGILLFQLFSSEPFYKPGQFRSKEDFATFMKNPDKVKKHSNSRVGNLPKDVPSAFRWMIKQMLKVNPFRRPNIERVLNTFEQMVFSQIYSISAFTILQFNRQMFENAYFDLTRDIKVENAVENLTIYLPKGYTYKGECVNGIPEGRGVIMIGEKPVLNAVFKEGTVVSDHEIRISPKDVIKITESRSGFPAKARVIYDKNMANQEESIVADFLEKSWLPNIELLHDKFNRFMFDTRVRPKQPSAKTKDEGNPWVESPLKASLAKNDLSKLLEIQINRAEEEAKKKKYKDSQDIRANGVGNDSPHDLHKILEQDKANYNDEELQIPLEKKLARHLKNEISGYLTFFTENTYMFNSSVTNVESRRFETNQQQEDQSDDRDNEDGLETMKVPNESKQFVASKEKVPFSDHTSKLMRKSTKETELQKDAMRKFEAYFSNFIDPFGNCLKMLYDRVCFQVIPYRGVIMTQLEPSKLFHITIFKPDISTVQVFESRISNFGICDLGKPLKNLADLNNFIRESRFDYVIINEIRNKQYRGAIDEGGPTTGRLYLTQNKYVDFEKSLGSTSKGIVVDSSNNTEYEGGLVNVKKSGYGKLKHNGKLVYIGNFKDGMPHGKGLFLSDKGVLIFKGIFSKGMKRYGTTIGNNRLEVNGIYNLMSKSPAVEQQRDITSFLEEMKTPDSQYLVEGNIREKRKYPVYYSKFMGWEMKFEGPVKIEYDHGAYFFGYYKNGLKNGRGVMVDSNSNHLIGIWLGDTVKGNLKFNEKISGSESVRSGNFVVQGPPSIIQGGIGQIKYKDGRLYRGFIENNLPHGVGRMKYPNGDEYQGEFEQGNYNGYGTLSAISKKSEYIGYFRNNKLEAVGFFQTPSRKMLGMWEDNLMRWMFSEKTTRRLNEFIISSIQSKVEFNHMENTYSKRGMCEMVFQKLITKERPLSALVFEIVSLVFQSVLILKDKQTDNFRMAYFILESMQRDFTKQHFNQSTISEEQNSLDFSQMVKIGIQRFCSEGPLDKTKEDGFRSREHYQTARRNYMLNREEIDTLIEGTLRRVEAEINNLDGSRCLDIIKSIPGSGFFDPRQTILKEKLSHNYKSQFLSIFRPVVGDLTKSILRTIEDREETEESDKADNISISRMRDDATEVSISRYGSDRTDKSNYATLPPLERTTTGGVKELIRQNFLARQKLSSKQFLPDFGGSGSGHLKSSRASKMERLKTEETGKSFDRLDNPESKEWLANLQKIWVRVLQQIEKILTDYNNQIPDIYSGEIFNDEINGTGVIIKDGQIIYSGEFKDNMTNGLGELKLDARRKFQGFIERKLPQGFGVLYCGSSNYEGTFLDGKRNGLIVKTYKKKIVAIANYDEDERDGAVIERTPHGKEMFMLFEGGVVRFTSVYPKGTLFDTEGTIGSISSISNRTLESIVLNQ